MKHPSFVAMLLLLFSAASAQKQPGNEKTITVTLNCGDYTVKAEVLQKNSRQKIRSAYTYHWYGANRINQTQGGFDGRLLEGAYTAFYLDNNLKEKGRFEKGLREGLWTSWFPNGRIRETAEFRHGQKHGTVHVYNDAGILLRKEEYRNGLLHGRVQAFENDTVKSTLLYKEGKEIPPRPEKIKTAKAAKDSSGAAEKKQPKKTLKEHFPKKAKSSGQPETPKEEKKKASAPSEAEKKKKEKKKGETATQK